MKHRDRAPEQDDLLRPRLVDMIDMRHELVKLAGLIEWGWFEREWAGFFPSTSGRPATHPRLVAGLMYLQHTYGLSDEAVVSRWVETPYFQYFTGETFFQHTAPIHPSSLSRWRDRIGEEGAEWLLTKTIQANRTVGIIDDDRLSRVSVDTTVMEKNIAHPTDARLYEKARTKLVVLAKKLGIDLRQTYAQGTAAGAADRALRPCAPVQADAQGAENAAWLHRSRPARQRGRVAGTGLEAAAPGPEGQGKDLRAARARGRLHLQG
jgi:IS5 family transposase